MMKQYVPKLAYYSATYCFLRVHSISRRIRMQHALFTFISAIFFLLLTGQTVALQAFTFDHMRRYFLLSMMSTNNPLCLVSGPFTRPHPAIWRIVFGECNTDAPLNMNK